MNGTPAMEIRALHVPYMGQFTNSYTFCTAHYRIFIDSALKSNEGNILPLLGDGRQPVVLLTHGHWDHIGCNERIKSHGGEIYASKNDLPWLTDLQLHWQIGFGQFLSDVTVPPERYDTFWREVGNVVAVDRFVHDSDELRFDDLMIRVIALPGHSCGSVGYYLPGEDILFTGDALMHTGFFGGLAQYYDAGSYRASMEKLTGLDAETVYTAHTAPYCHGTATQAAREAISFSEKIEAVVKEYIHQVDGPIAVGDAARYVCGKLGKKVGCGACICVLNHMAKMKETEGRLDLQRYICNI